MFTKHMNFNLLIINNKISIFSIAYIFMNVIAVCGDLSISRNLSCFYIIVIINKTTAIFYCIDKNSKLFEIRIECREHIDMIPTDAAYNGDMRMIFMKFRHSVNWRCQILIAFNNHILSRFTKSDHHIKTFQLSSNHKIRFNSSIFHHMKNHRSNCRFTMTATDYNSNFILTLFV